ncbi:DNA oxidative demethylase AlkB [Marinimicrobium alkaliphilum]|uniref:DNA oxidative demethylase AlkB n=1 Tax=Marinimicrobium alkaliphilum TaxID=2202654 RepID=UPI000DB9828E|nr:DNA oxidative demethylase AlkB [Marinimicrobium alkaliphilum]
MTDDLFADDTQPWQEPLTGGAVVLRRFALAEADGLLTDIEQVVTQAPWRQLFTPGGKPLSVRTSNCGAYGWISDRHGYRYAPRDPLTDTPWPAMPERFFRLAQRAAAEAGYPVFAPDACLINRYAVGTKMGLHQDRDEQDFSQPIVSVSLGLPATFAFGGAQRSDPTTKVLLTHGDVVVWGGPVRRHYHRVLTLKEGTHFPLGDCRINLTLRRAR